MQTVLNFLLRLVLLAAGLVFAASMVLAVVLIAVVWSLRYAWARLTGRPVAPFVMHINPRAGFGRVYRPGPGGMAARAEPGRAQERELGDVTDVVPKEPRS